LEENIIIDQLALIIQLLGKVVFKPEDVRKIVVGTHRKNLLNWIKAYNLFDGERTIQYEIANEAGVNNGDLSNDLREWKEKGIIFKVKNKEGKMCYKAITYLEEKEE